MISPTTLQDSIVSKLQGILELVDFLGDTASIQAYDDESILAGTADLAELGMTGRAVLVVWNGAELPREGETRGWTHSFRIHLKAESITSYYTLAQLIIDGQPAGDCESFLNCNISDLTDGIQNVSIVPSTAADNIGRLSIDFTITER